jgi:TolA-binding protein
VNFNGKEALKKGIADLDKKKRDNYLETLPLYYYPPKQDLTSAFPSFDRAIEKASKSVFKHSILIRGKEYVKPMNTAYMMMGKAYFYKQDYSQAKRVFNYIINTYKDWGSVEEATIWLARCEMQQDYFVRAQSILDEVGPTMHQKKIKTNAIRDDDELKIKSKSPPKKSKNKYNKYAKKRQAAIAKNHAKAKKKAKPSQRKITNNVRLQYYAAEAEYNLLAPNGEIESAIENIKIALQYRPKKDLRVRMYFILGQLYEKLENQQAAQNWFLKVIRATPEYEMEFSARMHLALNYDGTPLSKKAVMKELNKMLKDSKNEDYRDQIYYAISEIARIDENDADREFYLAKSVAAYTRNGYQRTFSAITLADIFFNEEEYISAQAYYDTALMSLPQNFPNRDHIIQKASVLRDLVDNLQMIQLQDSLQRIAKMSESERRNWVNQMILAYTEEERRLAKEEADRQLALQATQNFANINVNTQGHSTKWYFYNPGLVSQGVTEFYRRFGNRKLEDNWRVSNRNIISFEDMEDMNLGIERGEEEEFDEDGNPIKRRETDPKKPEYYTQDLPMTPGAIDTSNMLIADAMYNAGIIYFDQLNDLKRSCEMLQRLIQRFPSHDLVLPCHFLLWTNYTKLRNIPKAEEAKNVILTKYPDTDYAKLILDPDYYKKMEDAAKENERNYELVYEAYNNKHWVRTVQLADNLLTQSKNVALTSKTAYLRAVAIGQLQDQDALKNALVQVISDYPREEVAELAKIYLSTLTTAGQTMNELMGTSAYLTETISEVQESPFNSDLSEQHYVIVLVDIHQRNINDVKYDISTFNTTYFSLERFNINSFYINQNEQLVTIARFKGKSDAMNYYTALTTNDVFAPGIQENSLTVYPISASNYSIFYNRVDARRLYKKFVEENYL